MAFIAGRYAMTYGATGSEATVGQLQGGVTISHQFMKQPVVGDNMGQTVQDSVILGADVTASSTLMEYDNAVVASVFWPYGTAYLSFLEANIGKLDVQSQLTNSCILTVVGGSANDNTAPSTVTAAEVALQAGAGVDILFSPEHRVIPFRMRLYPTLSGGNLEFAVVA